MHDDSQPELTLPPDAPPIVEKPAKEKYSLQEFADDLKAVLMSPRQFTQRNAGSGGLGKPFLFVAICSMIGSIGYGLVHQMYISIANIWIASILGNYMTGFLFHWLFKLFGGKATLRDSFRACNYSIAPSVVSGIPLLGIVAAVYSAVILFFAMRTVHQTSTVKAALLVGIPLIILTVAGFLLMSHGSPPPR